MSSLSDFVGNKPSKVAAYPALKSSIVLFDCNHGTRSWTVPEGVSKIRAFVVGAGGGGQSGSNSYFGGAGGYAEKLIDVTPGQLINYTVGAGASGPGITGGTSSFDAAISASGGTGATGDVSGVGGSGTGGDINTSGGFGGRPGHAFGNGGTLFGLSTVSVDGWKIGLLPAEMDYGVGKTPLSPAYGLAVIGAGAPNNFVAGNGLVGIEVIA